ncbi:MAG: sulfite exporter TauE/SafE family protein [Bdellovibrionales bacterium]|nr:sulfite exporter TauE/SafE family protein [Bdellovibrionales bacterium]
MSSELSVALASLGIFIGEFYGNFVGGGSIVTQFFLQNLLGFDIRTAIALDNAAVLGSELGLLFMLLRKQRVERYQIFFVLACLVGSLLGAEVLRVVPRETLEFIFTGVVIIVLAKILFFGKEPESSDHFHLSLRNLLLLSLFGLGIGFYNALLSVGDFIFGLLGLIYFFRFQYHKALFLLSLSLVFGRGLASIRYFQFGFLDMDFLVPMFFAAMASGLIVGGLVHKVKTEKILVLLKVVGTVLAGSLIYNMT